MSQHHPDQPSENRRKFTMIWTVIGGIAVLAGIFALLVALVR
ncbi:hypothetical protein [Aeromicrobium alkaliterrae]|uniref:Uncharacterized protein n=1 Tax=Aeromicrobium alkaliterrae TaxID=302168 RepID=A0ABP4WAL3_9ACTN